MNHPFQCIATIESSSSASNSIKYLLAACGPKLISVSLNDGRIVSEWAAGVDSEHTPSSGATKVDGSENGRTPAKKQKTASNATTIPNVIKLTISPNNRYAVVVTDDKCVRVFDTQQNGRLLELSQRSMPKRPCAIEVLPDNATILCGDKFGDVYSLPLLPELKISDEDRVSDAAEPEAIDDSAKSFKPSASNLTVHTQRNLKALEAQLKQKSSTTKTKQPLDFEHKLLLGHVSMLTNLTYATQEVDGKQRRYIITADRDEHIRVSRGPPQSHVIEGYCLGHKEFISKVCVLPQTNLLASGGGDGWLGVWDWTTFTLRAKIDRPGGPNDAVSGMWIVPAEIDSRLEDVVVVTCEKLSLIAYLPVPELLKSEHKEIAWASESFDSPILDVACVGRTMLVSFDVRETSKSRLRAYRLQARKANEIKAKLDECLDECLKTVNDLTSEIVDEKGLDSVLYGVRNLRKRADHHDIEEAGEERFAIPGRTSP